MDRKEQKSFRKSFSREVPEFDQKIIDLARVTRVMAGGKRMRFRACVAIGNKKGQFGIGIAKGADVTVAVTKAVNKAKKKLINITLVNDTIPHVIRVKYKAARLLLKPAPRGTGIKAGGAVRMLMELAGVPNIVGKILGTNNKITNVKAVMSAFENHILNRAEIKASRLKQVKKMPEKKMVDVAADKPVEKATKAEKKGKEGDKGEKIEEGEEEVKK